MINGGDDRSGPAGPEQTDAYTRAYDDALSRLFDGSEPSLDEGDETGAGARASDDVALISRALRLIGAEAAGDADVRAGVESPDAADDDTRETVIGVGAGGPAGAEVDARVLPLRPVPPPADPVELDDSPVPARRRLPSAGVLAAAASLVLAVAVGIPAVNGNFNGSGDDSTAAVQQPAPAGALNSGDQYNAEVPTAAGADAAAAAPAADAGADAAAAPAADAGASAAAPAAGAAAPSAKTAKAAKAAKTAAQMPLAQAVECSRAVLVGELVGVTDAKLSYRATWTLRVTEWVRPTSGPAEVTYVVGGRRASLAGGGLGTLPPGQTGLFLVPADKDAPIRAWTGLDQAAGRDKVDAALAKGWSGGCP